MRTFIVLCFSLCLVKGSKGMSYFCLLALLIRLPILYGLSAALCNLYMSHRLNHFLFKLSQSRRLQAFTRATLNDIA